ncbi:arylamine N-acetyltransferase (plasmid) [Streptomyces sp. NBC_00853]|uniref:arylamine N-acetyltransferase family protein n=1 Tax=Streptomyces sp. NBC_00853 TaxID=2903681 RepID=UPI002F91039E|nr:arylamine N-acetyltransferase [Streptomyces sp. NBC_00853]
MIDIESYLARIGYSGPTEPSVENLIALHRAHLLAVPYENFDIQLGQHSELDISVLEEKIVHRRRGGQCIELNALFSELLAALGYSVSRVAAHTELEGHHTERWCPHLALLVTCGDDTWLADVGFGDAFLEPLPFRDGTYNQGGFSFSLTEGYPWRVDLHGLGDDAGFYVWPEARSLSDFAYAHEWSGSSLDSPNVRTLTAFQMDDDHIRVLRGRTVTTITPAGRSRRLISDRSDFIEVLAGFGSLVTRSEIDRLWHLADVQHEQWLASRVVLDH